MQHRSNYSNVVALFATAFIVLVYLIVMTKVMPVCQAVRYELKIVD